MTLEEAFRKVIHDKMKLLKEKIKPQMDERLKLETVTPVTAQHYTMAVDNFDKALVELARGEDYQEAVYFFSRGCVNMGELLGKAEKEKKAS
jgi:hypothetical protein